MARRILHSVAVGAAALCALMGVQPVAGAAPPTHSIAEQVGPSLVHITTEFSGQVEVPFVDGPLWTPELTMKTGCTGYIVDPKGFIATAGHCVNGEDDEILDAMRERAVVELVKAGNRDKEWALTTLETAKRNKWPVRNAAGTVGETDREVTVRQPVGDDRVFGEETPVEVVDFQEFDEGDNAILKVETSKKLTALVISSRTPSPGDQITSIGFPGAVGAVVDESTVPQPSYKGGTVSSRQTVEGGIVRTEVSAEMGTGMSGGPTVNSQGAVIGTNSFGSRTDEIASFYFTTDNAALRTYLEGHGVTLRAERSESGVSVWVWLGPLIGVVTLLIVGGIILLVRRRRRRPSPPTGPMGMGGNGFGPPGPPFTSGPPPPSQQFGRPGGPPMGGPPPTAPVPGQAAPPRQVPPPPMPPQPAPPQGPFRPQGQPGTGGFPPQGPPATGGFPQAGPPPPGPFGGPPYPGPTTR